MRLWRLFGLDTATSAERRATFWVAVMFFASLAGTFLVRPLRSQFGVDRGVDALPYLYSLTLAATVGVVLPFWWLANRMPSRRFVPIVLHVCALGLVLLAAGLTTVGDYEWSRVPWFGEVFWGSYNALNVAVPALVWIHAVEHFGRSQAKRLFGFVAVGGTVGAGTGSWAAGALSDAPIWVGALVAAGLLEVAFLAFRASWPHCRRLEGGDSGERYAPGGLLQGVRIVFRDRRAGQIALYMMLIGVLATAFYAAQTELVGKELRRGSEQHAWLADVELYSQGLVLLLQLFATGRLMSRLPAVALLVSLPVVSIAGLGVWWLAPTAVAIFAVQVVRRGAQFAFDKPALDLL